MSQFSLLYLYNSFKHQVLKYVLAIRIACSTYVHTHKHNFSALEYVYFMHAYAIHIILYMKLALHIDSLVKTYYCIDGTARRTGTNAMYYKVIAPAMHNVECVVINV